jgi:hypothetical protein
MSSRERDHDPQIILTDPADARVAIRHDCGRVHEGGKGRQELVQQVG